MASLADARDGKVSSFAAFTGNADPALAAFYLDSTGGDLGQEVPESARCRPNAALWKVAYEV